jgi:CxxC motif-containing protein
MDVEMRDGEVVKVTGNTCPRGVSYAKVECVNPTRTLTTTVKLYNGIMEALPVKTKNPIPKSKIFDCIEALAGVSAKAPVWIGDVVLKDAAGTGIDIVATKEALPA